MTTKNRNARLLPPPSTNGSAPHVAAAATVEPTSNHRKKRRGKRPPERVRRGMAVEAIRRLAAEIGSNDPRRPMVSLARAIAAATREREITEPGGPLDAVIVAAESCDGVAERVLAAEAAAWGLAWAARAKKSGGASGAALERLVGLANGLVPSLEAGDTVPAGFVLVLGRLFADIDACERLVPVAVGAVEREITALVPAGGPIALTGSEEILRTVARWAGVHARAEATGGVPWSSHTSDAMLSAVDTALRLAPPTDRSPSRSGVRPGWAAILEVARPAGPKPAATAAAGGFAIIRSGWRRRDARILVDARGPGMHLEIAVGSRQLCCGEWSFQASADGVALEPAGPWVDSCFESDKDATFAEWTLPLSRGLQLERQLVLAPRDRVLLLADAIVPRDEGLRAVSADSPQLRMDLDYRSSLPVCNGLELESADETREMIAFDSSVRFLAMPLALPEWSSARCDGRFEAEPCRLILTQRSQIARTLAPIWIDLDPSRIGEQVTWRQLTVADTRQNLPSHRACGYRVQAGTSQWIAYRALDGARNRTVLGCNLSCEFLLGRIGRTGIVERLIEIQ